MTRVEFGGYGDSIPLIALPDPKVSSELPPQIITFDADGIFTKTDWEALGYNGFEVWCVGGAGGNGGDIPGRPSYGGAGGGGGLHRVSGLLADLSLDTPVVVGRAGVKGLDGVPQDRWGWATYLSYRYNATNPMMLLVVKGADFNISGMVDAAGNAIPPYFFSAEGAYLWFPNPNYVAPQDGGDGGASSFGGVIAQASGGKGGKHTPVYRNHMHDEDRLSQAYYNGIGGDGGEGGSGGRTLAGGGGLGATTVNPVPDFYGPGSLYQQQMPYLYTNAQDGQWTGDVGQGGGGGRGGTYRPNQPTHILYGSYSASLMHSAVPGTDYPGQNVVDFRYSDYGNYGAERPGSSGGNGSFSYADMSVYGARGSVAIPPGSTGRIIPGAGGGAKLPGKRWVGSSTKGYSPNGLVLVRIFKV